MSISSTEFKTHLGEYLNKAIKNPIYIKRRNQEAVLISKEEYDRLQAIEDSYWLDKAKKAEKKGYIGIDKTMAKIKDALNRSE